MLTSQQRDEHVGIKAMTLNFLSTYSGSDTGRAIGDTVSSFQELPV